MKIAFISFEYSPFIYGGAGVYADNIVKNLAMLGHEVHVFTFADETENLDNIIVHRLGNKSLPKILWIPSFWTSLYRNFRKIENHENGFDVIISNGFSELTLFNGLTNTPRILVMHQSAKKVIEIVKPSVLERIKNINNELGIAPIFDPIMVRRADRIVAVSGFVKRSLIEDLNIPNEKISVVYNGFNDSQINLDDDEKNKMRYKYGLENSMLLLFVGRISDKRKGLMQLLEAISLLEHKIDYKLFVVGSGKKESIIEYIKIHKLEKYVHLLGKVSDRELHTLYSLCDLYVSSSFYESFGLTLVEAMSAKKPVIARNIGGIGEVMSDKNGILLRDDSIETLSSSIMDVFTNYEKYKNIGIKNRSYALKKFSWPKSAKAMENIIIDICNKRG